MIIPEIKEAMLTNFDTSEEIEIDIKKENLPKLMNIVTADLYKNKVGAVVRELSTNCLDAHKSINSTERFVIILPTDYNNNTLIIRDFGPGLSADQMKNIFGSLGESTKEKTNEFTGCLGIGSKSPLSITPQFNIISHYKNEVISYSCYQSGGLPKLNKFGQSLVGINEENDNSKYLIFHSFTNDIEWYKNSMHGRFTYEETFIFGIKLQTYFTSISSTELNHYRTMVPEFINHNIIRMNLVLLDNNKIPTECELLFKKKDIEPDQELDLNESLEIKAYVLYNESELELDIPLEILDLDDLNNFEKNYFSSSNFSYFKIDLKQLVNIINLATNKKLIDTKTDSLLNYSFLSIDYKNIVFSDQNFQTTLNDVYDKTFRTGLRIEIPISTQYKSQVLEEVYKQLMFFDIKPKVYSLENNGPKLLPDFGFNYLLPEKEIYEISDNLYLFSNNTRYNGSSNQASHRLSNTYLENIFYHNKIRLVQGGVSYPVELSTVASIIKSASRDPRLGINMNDYYILDLFIKHTPNKMIMFFDIGEISFNPSREGLNYDVATCIKIYEKIKLCHIKYETEILQFLKSAKDELELILKYNFIRLNPNILKLSSASISNTQYIRDIIDGIKEIEIPNKEYTVLGTGKIILPNTRDNNLIINELLKKTKDLFKPLTQINNLLNKKEQVYQPQIWMKGSSNIKKMQPTSITNLLSFKSKPFFLLIDGKNYRKPLEENIFNIIKFNIKNSVDTYFKQLQFKGISDKEKESVEINIDINFKPVNINFYNKEVDIYDIMNKIFNYSIIIFKDYLDDEVLNNTNLVSFFKDHLKLNNGIYPEVLDYKQELKTLLKDGIIKPPEKVQKTSSYSGFGYMFSKEVMEKLKSPEYTFQKLLRMIRNKNAENYELVLDENYTEADLLTDLRSKKAFIINYNQKTNTIILPEEYSEEEKSNTVNEIRRKKILNKVSQIITNPNNFLDIYIWFLLESNIITEDTKIIITKNQNIKKIKKINMAEFDLFNFSNLTKHFEKITTELNNRQFIKFDQYFRSNINTTFLKNFTFFNGYKKVGFEEYLNDPIKTMELNYYIVSLPSYSSPEIKNFNQNILPEVFLNYEIFLRAQKLAFGKINYNNNHKYQIGSVLDDAFGLYKMTSLFGIIAYNNLIINKISEYFPLDDIIYDDEENLISKYNKETIKENLNSLKNKIVELKDKNSNPIFNMSVLTSNPYNELPLVNSYKYLLIDELLHYSTRLNSNNNYFNKNDCILFIKIYNRFKELNPNLFKYPENFFGLISNSTDFEKKILHIKSGDIILQNDILFLNEGSTKTVYISPTQRKKIIKKYIFNNSLIKKEVKLIKEKIKRNTLMEIHRNMEKLIKNCYMYDPTKNIVTHNKKFKTTTYTFFKDLTKQCA